MECYFSIQMVSEEKAISGGFNNFFTNFGQFQLKQIDHCHNISFSDFMSNSMLNSLFLEPAIDDFFKLYPI